MNCVAAELHRAFVTTVVTGPPAARPGASFSQETLPGALMPDQTVIRARALRMGTRNKACATFEEHRNGSIERGKLADLVVLSADPLTVPGDAFLGVRVLETTVGGRTVHEHARL